MGVMAQRVRFFADWFAEFPLWLADGQDADDLIRDESFPEELVDRLRKWCDEFNEQPHSEPPHGQGPDGEWLADWTDRGRVLADEVAAHLGDGYVVHFER